MQWLSPERSLLVFVLKFIGKILVFPVMVIAMLIKWVLVFLVSFSTVILNLLVGIIFLTAILSYAFRMEDGTEVLMMLFMAFVVFIIPVTGQGMIAVAKSLQF